ncbi:uncharacterized protein IL334_004850 [Kwoniella shivajii]|uniref:Uncharacterized protein n=1 Tax=Kwoniella shivajii TaxID=564305 RepID=A0ABZ1D1W6_9TREE|nr:hypothetical protein IL334_004850 [Kwoniella shivajii]
MGCFSSKGIDPGMISLPISAPSQFQHQQSYAHGYDHGQEDYYPPQASSSHSGSAMSPRLGSYQFPTHSFAQNLPPEHPFANPYHRYMP